MLPGTIAKQYLKKYRNISSLQLARVLNKDHPLVFDSVETARTIVRYYRGADGNTHRKYLKDKEYIRPIEEALKSKYNPFNLPDPVEDTWTPVSLPFSKGRGLVIADLHVPYHSIEAITLSLRWAKEKGYTDFLLIDGDLNDHYQLSRYERDPEQRSFVKELEDTIQFLDAVETALPKSQVIIKFGNHDNRLESYIRRKAPELKGIERFLKQDYLNLKDRGFITVPHDVPIQIGKLSILHGHEIQSLSTVVNPARGAYLKTLECVLLAHCHRTSQHAETSLSGRLDTSWSIGCLCQLHPEYARINKWNLGFCGLEFDGDDFQIENKRIVKGTVR